MLLVVAKASLPALVPSQALPLPPLFSSLGAALGWSATRFSIGIGDLVLLACKAYDPSAARWLPSRRRSDRNTAIQNRCTETIALLAPIYNRFTEGFETADLRAAAALIDGFYNTEGTSRWPLMDASRDGAAPTNMIAA